MNAHKRKRNFVIVNSYMQLWQISYFTVTGNWIHDYGMYP